jgi:cell division protein FtsI (penicillin-binding protein 3)
MLETQSTRRLKWLLWCLLAWVGCIFTRLVSLQVYQHDELLRQAQIQQQKTEQIPALRGSILDRFGQPLAKSLPADSICVNPQKIQNPGVAASMLAGLLELDRKKLYERMTSAKLRGSGFLWVKRKVSADEAERVRSLKLDWVEFRPEMRRYYPRNEMASHVVGSTGVVDDSDADRGNAGIELAFDEELSGRPGQARVYTDVKQNAYDSVVIRPPDPGVNIKLTLDPNLQYVAEKALDKAMEATHARSGSIVAVNPYQGDILAMANSPRFDPNNPPGKGEPPNARSNIAISTPFEPGSVLKVVTLSSALETTSLRPDSIINCLNGLIKFPGREIHDEHRYGALSMADVLAKSSNIGAIQIGLKVGSAELYKYERRFGFGQKSGVDLPGESAGLLHPVKDWGATSIASIAFGHEIAVTSLQLALAGAAIANGGMMVKPRIVLSRQKPGHSEERFEPEKAERILSPETAIQMRQMMEGVVLRGTGRGLANLSGYTSAGKTGTAMIYDTKTHLYTHHYNASFLGFAPVTNPQVVIIVTLEDTSGGTSAFGGPVAAPVFREVATHALRILDVPKDLPEKTSPDLPLRSASSPAHDLDQADADQPSVSSVTPPPVRAGLPASSGGLVSPQGESPGRRPFLITAMSPRSGPVAQRGR